MLIVQLSGTGRRVEIPDAVQCVDTDDADFVSFLDSQGRCLVRFSRADVAIYLTPEQAELVSERVSGDGVHAT